MTLELDYITWLRNELSAYDALNMLHLHELGVGWYRLHDVADHFSTYRSNINVSMIRLREKGLIAYESYGAGGTFLWWIKSSLEDQPNRERDFPKWVLCDQDNHSVRTNIKLGRQKAWAEANRVSLGTLKNFLSGRQRVLLGKWVIQSSPLTKATVCE
jgi:hypothetical protein